jgi:O-methyltransferase
MPGAARDLYLDLLIKILTNTIYRDPSTHPLNRGPFQVELRTAGEDWPLLAHTMVGVRRLENLRQLAQRTIDERVPGDFIETGVWRGGCCILLRGLLAANGVTDRRVYAADSFAGLPAPRPELYPEDAGWDLDRYKQLAVPLDRVKENFARYGLLDEQVVFIQGMFADTLPALAVGALALIRLDGDLYESTHVALQALYPRLSPGGFVIVDDFGQVPPCRKAVIDYRSAMGIDAPIHAADATGVWWQKGEPAGNGVRDRVSSNPA